MTSSSPSSSETEVTTQTRSSTTVRQRVQRVFKRTKSPSSANGSTSTLKATSTSSALSRARSLSSFRRSQSTEKKQFLARSRPRARDSPLDVQSEHNINGLFNFAILAVCVCALVLPTLHYYETGEFVDLSLFYLMANDTHTLFLYVCAMGVYAFSSLFLQWLIIRGWRGWKFSVLHHGLQSGLFVYCSVVTYEREANWSITQRGALSMQMVVLYMKMHSFVMANLELASQSRSRASSGVGVASLPPVSSSKKKRTTLGSSETSTGAVITEEKEIHTKEKNGNLKEHSETQTVASQLRTHANGSASSPKSAFSTESNGVTYPPSNRVYGPEDVTVKHWLYFLFSPTLVFEVEYPRTRRFRWGYFTHKVVAGVGSLLLGYYVAAHFVVPVLTDSVEKSFVELFLRLLVPSVTIWFCIFYFVFEIFLNVLAEFMYFADREFYRDWWNSTTFDEFARKWNTLVHKFLLRHVYLELLEEWRFGKSISMILTFIFSALIHEFVLTMTFQRICPILFVLTMGEIVLVIGSGWMKHTKFGNVFFWLGMCTGMPLLFLSYGRVYVQQDSVTCSLWPAVEYFNS